MSIQKRHIKAARWDIYPSCNLRCIHCSAESLFCRSNFNYLDVEASIKLLNRLWRDGLTHLIILGKEPFLHPNIYKILSHACWLGFNVDVTTNGTVIKENDISRIIDMGLQSLYLSIDGSRSKINDAIRGNGVFQKTLKTLQKLSDEKEKKKVATLINVNTVLTRINQADIHNIISLCLDNGVNLFKLSHLVNMGNASRNMKELYVAPDIEFRVAEEVLKERSYIRRLSLDILSDKPMFLDYMYKKYKYEIPVGLTGCKACSREIYISPEGWISPCLGTSHGFSYTSNDSGAQFKTNVSELADSSVYDLGFYKEFKLAFALIKDTYRNYRPCISCSFLTTICFPCPLNSLKGSHREDLCLLAMERLAN